VTSFSTEHTPDAIRVLVLTTSFPLREGPPSGPFVKRLVEHLPQHVEATVLTPCFGRRQCYREDSGYRVKCFRYGPLTWQRLAHVPGGIPAALKANPFLYLILPWFLVCMGTACWRAASGVDLIHANWSVNAVLAGIVARLRGLPLVTTLRGEDISRSGSSRLFRWLLKRCLDSSSRVVVVSEAFKDLIESRMPRMVGRIEVIPNGVERALLDEAIREETGAPLNLVAVGSLIPRKSVSTLIGALARLPDPAAVNLVIVGDGPQRAELERLAASAGVDGSVRFVGTVPPDRVVEYLRPAHALVLCSLSEGRPNVVLEAMAAGVAVVATAIDGVTEIVGDGSTGLLFDPQDETQLAQHLERLCHDPGLCVRMAREARAWIVSRGLSWDATGERYSRVYHETLRGRA